MKILSMLVSHSIWHLFFEAKKLSHIKRVNEMTDKDVFFILVEDLVT